MRARRFVLFAFTILAGLVLGLVYGWWINPSVAAGSNFTDLRADYQADYVLMVAEAYAADADPQAASAALAPLGDLPVRQVQLAILTAQQLGWPQKDLERMAILSQALQFWTPAPPQVTPTP